MEINNNMQVRVSVRNFIEFLLRSGDIDNRHGGMKEKEAMTEGSRLHRKIQGKMGPEYQAEVSLRHSVLWKEMELTIEGRADGIITPYEEEQPVVVDEIKCVYRRLNRITEPVLVHMAQAKIYAYIYAKQNNLSQIQVRISYCNIETEEMKYFHEDFSFHNLENWFLGLVEEYGKWMEDYGNWRKKRNESIGKMKFPYEYRKGQRELAGCVYRTVENKERLYIQAPTGTGKTLMTLYPAIKSVGVGNGEKIFYLTAKTITRTVAKETVELLKEKCLSYRVLEITAKEKICFLENMECNPVSCPYAKGHFDRVNDAVFDLITSKDTYHKEDVEEFARIHQVCPFEMSLDVAYWADCIICDYNYVFDPNVYLKRFFQDGGKGDYIFLTDEAHNLLERGREMYSAVLRKEEFLEVKNYVKEADVKLAKRLENCNRHLLEYKRECEKCMVLESTSAFVMSLLRLQKELEKFMEKDESIPDKTKISELYLNVRHFLNMQEMPEENYVTFAEHLPDGGFMIKHLCVDPSYSLKECFERGRSGVLFSATLLPIKYYKGLLTQEEDKAVYADSPFDNKNRGLFIARDVSTKYSRRNAIEYQKIADYIKKIVSAKEGNYLVFFPSYAYMEAVYEIYSSKFQTEEEILIQSQNMTEEEREEFLKRFDETEGILAGFCVMGGIFSEGIDLKEEKLIGSIIVGTGLPGIGTERELLKAKFDAQGKKGFDYAYRFPGMNKVMQAAGRVIRTAKDIGVVVLLDERFAQREYTELYPREWNNLQYTSLERIEEQLKEFWG